MSDKKVDQQQYAEWQRKKTTVEVRRRSPHRAILVGRIQEFDLRSFTLLEDGAEEPALCYIDDISTVVPKKN